MAPVETTVRVGGTAKRILAGDRNLHSATTKHTAKRRKPSWVSDSVVSTNRDAAASFRFGLDTVRKHDAPTGFQKVDAVLERIATRERENGVQSSRRRNTQLVLG